MTLELTVEIDGPTAKRLQQIAERSRLEGGGQPDLEDVAADALAQWSERTLQQLALAAEESEGESGRRADGRGGASRGGARSIDAGGGGRAARDRGSSAGDDHDLDGADDRDLAGDGGRDRAADDARDPADCDDPASDGD